MKNHKIFILALTLVFIITIIGFITICNQHTRHVNENHTYIKGFEDQKENYLTSEFSSKYLYGHGIGDKVLVSISRLAESELRANDILARWGGEEFICLLPHTPLNDSKIVAEKIRHSIENSNILPNEIITVSIGISQLDKIDTDPLEIVTRADNAMYTAKRNGRNRVL